MTSPMQPFLYIHDAVLREVAATLGMAVGRVD